MRLLLKEKGMFFNSNGLLAERGRSVEIVGWKIVELVISSVLTSPVPIMAPRFYLESNNVTSSSGSSETDTFLGIHRDEGIIGGAVTLGVLLIFVGLCVVTYRTRRRLQEERRKKSVKLDLKSSNDNSDSTIASDAESLQDFNFSDKNEKYASSRRMIKLSVRYDEQYSDPAHTPSTIPYYLQPSISKTVDEEEEKNRTSMRNLYPDDASLDGSPMDLENQGERKILEFYTNFRLGNSKSYDSNDPNRASFNSKRSFSTVSSYPLPQSSLKRKNSAGGEDGNSQFTGRFNYDDFSAPSRFSYYMRPASEDPVAGNFLSVSGDSQAPTVKNHISLLPRRKFNGNKQLRFQMDDNDSKQGIVPEYDEVSLITYAIEEENEYEADEGGIKNLKTTSDDSAIWIKLKTSRDTVYPV